MRADAPVNGCLELSSRTLAIARRNAKDMTKQGYEWAECEECCSYVRGRFQPEAGTVYSPRGDTYSVWLPGVLDSYPEGKCECAFFAANAICKHIFFAVEQTGNTSVIASMTAVHTVCELAY